MEKPRREMELGRGHQNGGSRNCCFLLSNRFGSKVHVPTHRVWVNMLILVVVVNRRRRIAVGLENGRLLIYSSKRTSPSEYVLELTVDSS
jgi:hypothetical protein